jgi:DNA (cytosine-5)-methyltransferase 1
MLEDSVDSKYLLNQELVEKYLTTGTASNHKGSQAGKVVDENNDTFHNVNAGTHGYSMGYVKLNQTHQLKIKGNDSIKRIYSSDGLCPSLTTMQGGYREPKVALLIKEEFETNAEVAPNNYIFRKLTERECFRLQGFDDSFIFPPKISSTQLYKQAGNGMSRNILKMLFTQILIAYTKHIEGKQNENI